jgi:hypothetical protein
MEQLLLHFIGDFIFQNDEIGLRKKEKSWMGFVFCLCHCIVYGAVFLLITNWVGAVLIGFAHFILDRWHVVSHIIRWKNGVSHVKNFGYVEERPVFMTAWLYIIHDNGLHLVCNYLIIKYIHHVL